MNAKVVYLCISAVDLLFFPALVSQLLGSLRGSETVTKTPQFKSV